jgi:hypothetical protein
MPEFQSVDGKPLIGSKPVDGPIIRLLRCFVCETWEELPDYEGRSDQDYLLQIAVEKHVFPSGDPHVGKLFKVPVKVWANPEERRAVLDQLGRGGSKGLDDLDPDKKFYETKMTFASDAMECWIKHTAQKTIAKIIKSLQNGYYQILQWNVKNWGCQNQSTWKAQRFTHVISARITEKLYNVNVKF